MPSELSQSKASITCKARQLQLSNLSLIHYYSVVYFVPLFYKWLYLIIIVFYRPLESMQREVPVLVIDCDDEFEDSEEKQAKILGQVDKFIDSILITDDWNIIIVFINYTHARRGCLEES